MNSLTLQIIGTSFLTHTTGIQKKNYLVFWKVRKTERDMELLIDLFKAND